MIDFDFTDEQMDKIAKQLAEELIELKRKRLEFRSKRQEACLDKLAAYIQEHKFLDSDHFIYKDNFKLDMAPEEFNFLFDDIMSASKTLGKQTIDEEIDFQNEVCFLTHNGITMKFFVAWGQGTLMQVIIVLDETDKANWITFDEVKREQALEKKN